jgi:EAL domain-containing protein (putative c-di-GMP-specific phosphodiesterase class I)
MRRAVRDEGFEIHYQPQIAVDSAEVVGMEALLRWNDPQHGAVAPSAFIAIAEETGLIVSLGEWVLRQACIEARDLQQRCGKRLRLAVNISARQFRHGNLVAAVTDALSVSGLPAEDLELEITESVLMTDADGTADRLRELRQLGVRIAIDDFGVGFSSLSYIGRFPIDTLKIDRSFIHDLPDKKSDAAVVEAVMAMAAALELDVVAEGVENPAQFNTFVSRQLHTSARASVLVQGFCLSPAVSAEQFAADFPAWRRKVRRLYLSLS